MSDLYCVFGNPIAHSKSPRIQSAFAHQTGQDMTYTIQLAPIDGFAACVRQFIASGGRGANVTSPFKTEAFLLATRRTARAELAGAVNTLIFSGDEILGDNSDGAGLIRDITHNLHYPIAGQRVLLLGAGGATRGVIAPLLEAGAEHLTIANRTISKADTLLAQFVSHAQAPGKLSSSTYAALSGQSFDLVINATSASLNGQEVALPCGIFAPGCLTYEMAYGLVDTPFSRFAKQQGTAIFSEGLGMLVEQAAESFKVWRGIYPDSAAVLAMLKEAH